MKKKRENKYQLVSGVVIGSLTTNTSRSKVSTACGEGGE